MTKVRGSEFCGFAQADLRREDRKRMKTRCFRDLQVWQRSMELARKVYAVTNTFPRSETFGLTSQLRRAAVSVPSNIAEGRGRLTDKSFAVFLAQARGSLYELETQIELAASLGFADSQQADSLITEAAQIAAMIQSLLAGVRSNTEQAQPVISKHRP
jgi:four helix bundle protein